MNQKSFQPLINSGYKPTNWKFMENVMEPTASDTFPTLEPFKANASHNLTYEHNANDFLQAVLDWANRKVGTQ